MRYNKEEIILYKLWRKRVKTLHFAFQNRVKPV